MLIGLLILPRTWSLLRQALDVLLEASPRGVDIAEVRQHILETSGVLGLHDLHVWTITSGLNAVSAHVIVAEDADRKLRPRDIFLHQSLPVLRYDRARCFLQGLRSTGDARIDAAAGRHGKAK